MNPWPFADAVRAAQKEKGLSIRGAAKASGVPTTTYYSAVTAQRTPQPETTVRLLRFAGVGAAEAARLQGFS